MTISHDDCWLYAGLVSHQGYGLLYSNGKIYRAHRIMYEQVHGELPPDIILDHLCRVRHCVNPKHLEAVTQLINKMRGLSPAAQNARRTHCRQGHEYNSDNTLTTQQGWRQCRICSRANKKLHRIK